ncbi:MAG: hypothetical protein QOJ98_3085, partial [Acidobacteriota bacterium]|nr:hypothetical protein [Acidobacteriota bacterium]
VAAAATVQALHDALVERLATEDVAAP